MKKVLSSVLLLTSVYATAGENYYQNAWDAKGLLAIEGMFGTAQTKLTEPNPAGGDHVIKNEGNSAFGGGLKLGGESEHYRLFVSGRYHAVDNYDYVVTAGLELQYLLRFTEYFDIFLGINGGMMGSQATISSTEYSVWNPYAGADAGVNIDVAENFGIELGVRMNQAFADSSEVGSVDNLVEGYASLVFKFTSDY